MKGNFFAFNSWQDFIEICERPEDHHNWEYIERRGDDPPAGTLISPKLREHWFRYFEDCKDQKYVIAFNRYLGRDGSYEYNREWPKSFKGEHLIFNDATDKTFCFPPFMEFCIEQRGWGTYFKKNLGWNNDYYNEWKLKPHRSDWPQEDTGKLFSAGQYMGWLKPAPESPPAGNLKAVLEHDIQWVPWDERKYDIFFAGQTRSGYPVGDKVKGINDLKQSCDKMGLKSLIVDKNVNLMKEVGGHDNREAYMRAISQSKLCFNFSIGPLRNRREWEILLAGGALLQDPRTHNMEKDFMEPSKHYIYFDPQNMEDQIHTYLKGNGQEFVKSVAHLGYQLARNCWCTIPTLEFRLFFIATQTTKRIMNFYDLMEEERLQWGGTLG